MDHKSQGLYGDLHRTWELISIEPGKEIPEGEMLYVHHRGLGKKKTTMTIKGWPGSEGKSFGVWKS